MLDKHYTQGCAKTSQKAFDVGSELPPHDEPDFPWVNIEELAGAFLPEKEAKRITQATPHFSDGKRAIDKWPMSFDEIAHACRNPGGPFMRKEAQ